MENQVDHPKTLIRNDFMLSILFIAFLWIVSNPSAIAAGTNSINAPGSNAKNSTVSKPFRIVAYATEGIAENLIPYSKLTHINYSFLIPNADGTFKPIGNPARLKQIVESARNHHVRVSIAVGGWGWDSQFEAMASKESSRLAFVKNLTGFIRDYNLDGADIDWEYPDPGQSSKNFLSLIQELRAALPDKLLTAAVVAYGDSNGKGIASESFPLLDFVNIMTYDGGDHGTMAQFNKGLEYWKGRGLPPGKAVIGVPFYSRVKGSPGKSMAYAKLVSANPSAALTNTIELSGLIHSYNGISMIKEKTQIAMRSAGGIMFWVLDADASGELSLVNAIYQTVHPQ